MVAAQLVFRGWALFPSWFYLDDYRLLYDARSRGLSWSYLTAPFDSQFMPVGRFLAWLVASGGPLDWTLAVSLTLVLQAVASLACLAMLCSLFGARPAVLLLLATYLTTAMTLPATMWWAASLNQLPLQAVLFGAVTLGVRYLRTVRLRWALATAAVLVIGLLCYVKTLLVVPLLVFVALAYFASGSPLRRVRHIAATYWPGAAVVVALGGAFTWFYLATVPSLFQAAHHPVAGVLARTMIGRSLISAAWGGPWRWSTENPPVGYADPPLAAVLVAWLLLVVLVGVSTAARRRARRAWVLLALYVVALYLLVLATRAPVTGEVVGRELRYLTDGAAALVLCVGLAFLPLRGAVESSEPRAFSLGAALVARAGLLPALVLAVLVSASGLVSSAAYAHVWHTDNPGDDFMHRAQADLLRAAPVDLSDGVVPDDVVISFLYPYNTTRRLTSLMGARVRFPRVTSRLAVLAPDGSAHPALIHAFASSGPGPVPGCGWKVQDRPVAVPLTAPADGFHPWVRVGYLASGYSPVRLRLGSTTVRTEVRRGLNQIFVRTSQVFDRVRLDGLSPGTTVCVDDVAVGDPTPAEAGLS